MTECIYDYETNIRKTKTMSKDDELAAKTRRQVDNAVSWLEKRYFTNQVRAKKQFNDGITAKKRLNQVRGFYKAQ